MTCETCNWFRPDTRPPSGQCARHAPVLVLLPAGAVTRWPLTSADEKACGDYEKETTA